MEKSLDRFLKAQESSYQQAYNEIKNGEKCSHWIWYIFPQLEHLGHSWNSKYYGITDLSEAKAYWENETLQKRLLDICRQLLTHNDKPIEQIMGHLDARKLKSSMTLFDLVAPHSIFEQILENFFNGKRDSTTLRIATSTPKMILGAVAGDIIGSVYERNNIHTTDFPLFSPFCRFTDDSVMTLAVAQWLLEGNMTSDALVKIMQKLGREYIHAGYGGRFHEWLLSENPQPYNSWGNGSAMRVSPVGWYASSLEEALRLAEITASVSHNHPEGIKGAQAIAAAMFWAREGKGKQEIKALIEDTFLYDLEHTLDEIRPLYHFDVSCQGSVPEAILAYLEGNDFEEVIRLAISIGGDSDTIGAMAGAIASCTYPIPTAIARECASILSGDLNDILHDFTTFINQRNHTIK